MYLNTRGRTLLHISKRRKNFDISGLLEDLNTVRFPKSYLRGLKQVQLTILGKKYYGLYLDGNIWVDTKKKRKRSTVLETFVHEVAHHIHFNVDPGALLGLDREARCRGHYIHRKARGNDEEYFARGFERFYSLDPRKRESLRKRNPRLYNRICSLHYQHSR